MTQSFYRKPHITVPNTLFTSDVFINSDILIPMDIAIFILSVL